MNKEIKEKWLCALRGGKYKQGRNVLKKKNEKGEIEYCCLGVLCDIYLKNNNGKWVQGMSYSCEGRQNTLPNGVKDWSNFDDFRKEERLINQNDTKKENFKTIANWIEKNL